MNIHELKTSAQFFEGIVTGEKTFEVRKDDRGYRLGDVLHLRETRPADVLYTGREALAVVTYIVGNDVWLREGFVVLGVRLLHIELGRSL